MRITYFIHTLPNDNYVYALIDNIYRRACRVFKKNYNDINDKYTVYVIQF